MQQIGHSQLFKIGYKGVAFGQRLDRVLLEAFLTYEAEKGIHSKRIHREQGKVMRYANGMLQDGHRHTRNPKECKGDLYRDRL